MGGDFEREYSDFQLKLLQRRVFYYLILKGFNTGAIVKMLHKGDSQEEMSESMIKQIPSMLAIKANTDVPYNLLVEEKYFLYHYMRLPIYNIAELMDQTYSIINSVLSKHLKNDKIIINSLKNYCTNNDNQISFGAVSMTEVHVVLEKVIDALMKSNKSNLAQHLLNEITNVVIEIKDLVPDKTKFETSLKKLSFLNEKITRPI
jgi:hypothetical protein